MAKAPRLAPLKETDLAIPQSGSITGDQLREAFRRLFVQMNPWSDSINKTFSRGITLTDNLRVEVVSGTWSHGTSQDIPLKTLKRAAGVVVLGANSQIVAGSTVQMQSSGAARVTLWFNDSTAAGVSVALLLTEEGQQSSGAPTYSAGSTSPLTTKGDLYGRSTVDARLPVGTDGQVLTADSTQALGLKYATPSAGAGAWSLATKPAIAHADDDEFEGADTIGSTWTATVGTPSAGIITPNTAPAAGTFLYDWNISRKSWLMIQPGVSGVRAQIQKTITVPAIGDFLWLGFMVPRVASWIQVFFTSNGLISILRFNVSTNLVEYINAAGLVGSFTAGEFNNIFFFGLYRHNASDFRAYAANERGAWNLLGQAAHALGASATISLLINPAGATGERYGFDFFRHLSVAQSGGALP